MSETKIIDTIKIDDIEASILGAEYDKTNGGIAFQGGTASGEKAFATGQSAANGDYSYAEGHGSANGEYSHAEGWSSASGPYSHAEGSDCVANGEMSHAEGSVSQANGDYSHAEGDSTNAHGDGSHAEGSSTQAIGNNSHAEGQETVTGGDASHAEGFKSAANGAYSHAEGASYSNGQRAHSEGSSTADGPDSHAEGESTRAIGDGSHTEGCCSVAYGSYSHAEGDETIAYGSDSHAEGANTKAGGGASHTEGYNTTTATEFGYLILNADDAIEQDQDDILLTLYLDSVAGLETKQIIDFDVSNEDINYIQGTTITDIDTTLNKITVHSASQGSGDLMGFDFSAEERGFIFVVGHPELGSVARNGAPYAHAEGNSTQALGEASHAEGKDTKATGNYSHASGLGTIASEEAQTVIGKYNAEDSNALFIVGNGSATTPSNAFIVKNDGTVIAKGKELTANPTVDNTIQDFKVSNDFITTTNDVQTITRNEKTAFVYNYTNDNQYLNPPLRNYLDATGVSNKSKMTNGNIASKEYVTVERWMGLPVYQAVIKLKGSIEYIDIPWNAMENTDYTVFDATGLLIYDGTKTQSRNMPYGYAHIWGENNFQTGCLRIRKSSTSSLGDNYTILFTIKYVKATSADILDLT